MSTAKLTRNQLFALICLALAAVTLAVYWPVRYHAFTNIDDDGYITGNAHVKAGLTWPGIVWAFQSGFTGNWHPLTWISHMTDCQLFGLNPAGHHLMNLLFHTANTLLLFLLLDKLTGALWRSAFVAALFAWHPLHVESVAWAAERKDVLSAFFWMLALLAYTRYANSSKSGSPKPKVFYVMALILFACGLMSKPMVVTLPFVLLLLDFWPLKRIANCELRMTDFKILVMEKIPFFALSVASVFVTYQMQKNSGAVSGLSLHFRVENAVVSYVRYISKTFYPDDLALPYPLPHHWPLAWVIFAAVFLAAWSGLCILRAKELPYLAVGWFWFLGTLIPAIGLVQVGVQSMADRYTYIPSIGLFIPVVWGLNDFLNPHAQKMKIAAFAGSAALAGCLICTSLQLKYWQNSITLFAHSIRVTADNYLAYNCLGNALEEIGRNDEALALYTESVRVAPGYAPGQFNLGMMLLEKGDSDGAFNHLNAAVQIAPGNPLFQFDLATFLSQHGKLAAAGHFAAAIKEDPDFALAHGGLAQILSAEHKLDEAAFHYHEALRVWPEFPEAHNGLGLVLLQQSKPDEAIAQFSEAVRLKPDFAEAKTNLAVALAGRGKK